VSQSSCDLRASVDVTQVAIENGDALSRTSISGVGLDRFRFTSIHSNGSPRHPASSRRHEKSYQIGNLFRLPRLQNAASLQPKKKGCAMPRIPSASIVDDRLDAVSYVALGEGLRQCCNRGIDGSDGRQSSLGSQRRRAKVRTTAPRALSTASHALIVRHRAPWNFNDDPAFHPASAMANRSVCGTAPATLMRASIRP
jgi:hypothetical protein